MAGNADRLVVLVVPVMIEDAEARTLAARRVLKVGNANPSTMLLEEERHARDFRTGCGSSAASQDASAARWGRFRRRR
jgi:hypothetical protein